MPIKTNHKDIRLMCGGHKVAKIYCQNDIVYSSGNIVTYYIDTGIIYQEEIEDGASCLSPVSFTPEKSDWIFAGWRLDATAAEDTETNVTMGDSPITLYAVFRQPITITYYNGSNTASKFEEYKYYNNGNVTNPSFTLTQTELSGWTARGWSTGTVGNSDIKYSDGVSFITDSNITLYGMYQQTVSLYYNGNGATGGSTASQTGTRYYNSNGNVVNPSFILQANGFNRTSYTFAKWALESAGGTQYAPGADITVEKNTTMYAVWAYVGVPFYVVNSYTVQGNFLTSIPWTLQSEYNIVRFETWKSGMYGATLWGRVNNDSLTSWFKAISGPISTQGNRHIAVEAICPTVNGTITIAGVTKKASGQGSQVVYDISGLNTITIQIYSEIYGYNGDAYMQFGTIYLY